MFIGRFDLRLPVGHDLLGSGRADPFPRESFHDRYRTKWLLFSSFRHSLSLDDLNPARPIFAEVLICVE